MFVTLWGPMLQAAVTGVNAGYAADGNHPVNFGVAVFTGCMFLLSLVMAVKHG